MRLRVCRPVVSDSGELVTASVVVVVAVEAAIRVGELAGMLGLALDVPMAGETAAVVPRAACESSAVCAVALDSLGLLQLLSLQLLLVLMCTSTCCCFVADGVGVAELAFAFAGCGACTDVAMVVGAMASAVFALLAEVFGDTSGSSSEWREKYEIINEIIITRCQAVQAYVNVKTRFLNDCKNIYNNMIIIL